MKTTLHPIHRTLQTTPAWPVTPLPGEKAAVPPGNPDGDWEPILERYRQGDSLSLQLLCCRAKPLVEKISSKRYYAASLGREEAYSIAAMTMVEFWHGEALTGNGKDLPRRLTRAMNCDLINQIRRQNTRRQRELHYEADSDTEDEAEREWQDPLADRRDEPEQRILQAEWNRKVRDCLQYLGAKERQVIRGFFFRQLSITEIAREMHCTPACVSSTKRNALYKLRSIFSEQQVV